LREAAGDPASAALIRYKVESRRDSDRDSTPQRIKTARSDARIKTARIKTARIKTARSDARSKTARSSALEAAR
jgi:hypothetical protein